MTNVREYRHIKGPNDHITLATLS